jgi:hypothetical protein
MAKHDDNFGPYSSAADAKTLRAIRDFLFEEDSVLRMIVATDLVRPAVEPLSGGLLEKFGDVVRNNGVKKYIGWVARQALEERGYTVDQQNCLVRTGGLFSRATRYRLKK